MARTTDSHHPDAHRDAREPKKDPALEARVSVLEPEVTQLQGEFKGLGNRVYALETGIVVPQEEQASDSEQPTQQQDTLEARVSELEKDVHQLQLNYKDLGNRVYALETGITVPPTQVTPPPQGTGTLESRVTKLEADVAQLQLNSDNLDERVTALEQEQPPDTEQPPPNIEPPPDSNMTLQQLVDQGGAVTLPKDNYHEFCTVRKVTQITGQPTLIDVTGIVIGNQKAIFDAQQDLELRDITLVGATVPDENGAGVRGAIGASLKMNDCEIHDCQMGILMSGGNADIEIDSCYFHNNGAGLSSHMAHEIYVSAVNPGQYGPTNFIMTNSQSICGSRSCHALKVRATTMTVKDCTLRGSTSTNSGVSGSVVDIPEGGNLLIEDSEIEMHANSQTSTIFGYMTENTNQGVGTVTLRNVKVIDGRNRGGDFWCRSGIGGKLVLENCTYTADHAPNLIGWSNVTGQFTKA